MKRTERIARRALCISAPVLICLGSLTTSAFATTDCTTYTASTLSGSQIVPTPTTSSGTGTASIALSADTSTYVLSGSYSGLTGNATAVKIDYGTPSVNGGTILTLAGSGATSGTFQTAPAPWTGTIAADARLAELNIVVTTSTSPSGEIRGQFDAPATLGTVTGSATFTVGYSGAFTFAPTGYPVPTLTESGALPSGVTFANNAFAGTPAAGTEGSYPTYVTATNGIGSSITELETITVQDLPTTPTYTASTLSGSQIVPTPTTSSGTGTASIALSADTSTYVLSGSYSGLTGNATAVKIDYGTPSVNGGTILTLAGSGATSGTFQTAPAPWTGTIAADARLAELNIVVTTSTSPSGEIRGQFDAPATLGTVTGSATFTVGYSGAFTFAPTGYPVPTLTESGALPSGVTFANNAFAGTPAAGTEGSYPTYVTATNGIGSSITELETITVQDLPTTPTYTASTLSGSQIVPTPTTSSGTGTASIALSADTSTYVLSGSYSGLTGNATAVKIDYGTPSVNGGTILTLAGSGATSGTFQTAPAPWTGTIAADARLAELNIVVTTSTSPSGEIRGQFDAPATLGTVTGSATFTVGYSGAFTFAPTGYPVPTLTESGALPSGVTFANNAFAGTPAAGTEGSYPTYVTATNGIGSSITELETITVQGVPIFTSLSSTTFTAGASNSFTVKTAGGSCGCMTESGALPSGVTFSDDGNGTATISGVPPAGSTGDFPITISAQNTFGSATQQFDLSVATPPTLQWEMPAVSLQVGAPADATISVGGSPAPSIYLSGDSELPPGTAFVDNGNGTASIIGTPTDGSEGSWVIFVNASNGTDYSPQGAQLIYVGEPATITSPATASFSEGEETSFTVTATASPLDPDISITGLPDGLSWESSDDGTAAIYGVPASGTAGQYEVQVTAFGVVGSPATQTVALTVNPPPPPAADPPQIDPPQIFVSSAPQNSQTSSQTNAASSAVSTTSAPPSQGASTATVAAVPSSVPTAEVIPTTLSTPAVSGGAARSLVAAKVTTPKSSPASVSAVLHSTVTVTRVFAGTAKGTRIVVRLVGNGKTVATTSATVQPNHVVQYSTKALPSGKDQITFLQKGKVISTVAVLVTSRAGRKT